MGAVEEAKQRMEDLIQAHLRRNPKIAEPDGAANDWIFRDAVREQFRIYYDKFGLLWRYKLSNGRSRKKNCVEAGVLGTLRLVCEEQEMRKEAAKTKGRGSNTGMSHRKRSLHERVRHSELERDGGSDMSESSLSSAAESSYESKREALVYRLRQEVASLKCSNAGLRNIAEERLERIKGLEAGSGSNSDGCTADEATEGRAELPPGLYPGEVAVLTAEVEKWKEKFKEGMAAKDKECKAVVEELQRSRLINSKRERAMKEELRSLREETTSLREMLSDVQSEVNRMKAKDERIGAIQETLSRNSIYRQETLSSVKCLLDEAKRMQAPRSDIDVKAEVCSLEEGRHGG